MESRLVWPAFLTKNEKEQSYDERKKEKAAGWDAGTSS